MPDNRRGAARPGYSKKNSYIAEKRERASSRLATTLAELREKCGDYGDAAVARAEWSAVNIWLWREGHDVCQIDNAINAAAFGAAVAKTAAGLPNPNGGEQPDPAVGLMSTEIKALTATAAAVMEQWREAGQPHLSASAITRTHQYFIAARRAAGHDL